MAKVFISQPMKGKTHDEIIRERDALVKLLEEEGHTIIDSVFKEGPDPDNPHQGLWFLGESFKILSTADICIFMKGWDSARGCIMEHTACASYGIKIRYE